MGKSITNGIFSSKARLIARWYQPMFFERAEILTSTLHLIFPHLHGSNWLPKTKLLDISGITPKTRIPKSIQVHKCLVNIGK